MRTKEQIEVVENLIQNLQDYIELAKVERKLKDKENAEIIAKQIDDIKYYVLEQIKEI